MRKRSTVPTALYSADDARIVAPRATELRARFRDPHPTHRDDGSMGPSTDISRFRRAK